MIVKGIKKSFYVKLEHQSLNRGDGLRHQQSPAMQSWNSFPDVWMKPEPTFTPHVTLTHLMEGCAMALKASIFGLGDPNGSHNDSLCQWLSGPVYTTMF